MDYNLDVILPRSFKLKDIDIDEDLIEWGAERYSQNPAVYKWRNNLKLERCALPVIYTRMLDDYINAAQYDALTLKGNPLSELEWVVNKGGDIHENPVMEFINTLSANVEGWCLILSFDDEKIDIVKRVNKPFLCSDNLVEALHWNQAYGLILLNNFEFAMGDITA